MSRYTARIRQLEKRLAPPRQPRPVVVWTMSDLLDPPAWAEEAIRPHMPTDGRIAFVEWRQSRQDDALAVKINDQWYRVTEAGAEPMDPPMTIRLDNPNDAGLQPVMPKQARDMLREAGL